MKPFSLKSLSILLMAVFSLASLPVMASTAVAPVSATTQYQANTESGLTLKKKSEKHGFFAKIKKFGQKAKMFAKALAGGEKSAAVAILLAFFLGGLGLHRVYLGGRPILILFYIITFGGIFGLLPLIDFIRLIIGHMDHYEGNDKFLAAFS